MRQNIIEMSSTKKSEEPDLDAVIAEVGEFGKYQIGNFLLICLPIALSSTLLLNFFFTAATLDYRCKVPECDVTNTTPIWQPSWLSEAIPYNNNQSEKCKRFSTSVAEIFADIRRDECPVEIFNTTNIIDCTKFVYKSDEHILSNEFGLMCDQEYKLAFVGMVNNLARFTFMPLAGILTDKLGRLRMLIYGLMASGASGILQSFSTTFNMYLFMEFITAGVGTTVYGSGFVLGAEWVSSKYRVLTSIIIAGTVPLGEIILALCAMYFQNFRTLLLVIFTPCLLVFIYFWLVPESTRWLYVTGKYDIGENNLKKTAAANKREIAQKSLDSLRSQYESHDTKDIADRTHIPFTTVVTNKKLFIRFLSLSFCWVVNAFVFYGIGISSTRLQGDSNKYLSFIIVCCAEIPGTIAVILLLDRIGRRATLCATLTLSGTAIVLSAFIPDSYKAVTIVLFIIGKSAITCSFISLYVFTAELWPTGLRNTMMGFCSMVGRLGGVLAASVFLFAYISPELPFILLGLSALLAGVLILFNPETNGRKLPDTLNDINRL